MAGQDWEGRESDGPPTARLDGGVHESPAHRVGDVEFEFLWITTTTPLLVVILATIAVAVLLDEAVGFAWRRRRRTRMREHNELQRLRDRT